MCVDAFEVNIINFAISKAGRVTHDGNIFDWLHGFIRLRKFPTFITCTGKTDGAGAQAQAIVSTQAYAKFVGVRYAHTQFTSMEHAPDNDSGHWAQRWEQFLNLGDGEVPRNLLDVPCYTPEILRSQSIISERPMLITINEAHQYLDLHPNYYRLVIPLLQTKYNFADKAMLTLPKRHIPDVSVAVHVRRGDVSFNREPHRYTNNIRLLHLIQRIRILLREQTLTPQICIYSEGSIDDFRDFTGCDLHLNADAFFTFHNLVVADILIMAKSSFSYMAGLLSNGLHLYEPFWHPRLDNWLDADAFTDDQFRASYPHNKHECP